MSYTSFPFPGNSSVEKVPVNRAGIYVIPSGYTVETHLVIKEKLRAKAARGQGRETLFIDIVYPKSVREANRVPILLEGSSTATGEFVVNANTPILYSWIFNGYAFASMCYVRPEPADSTHSLIHCLRYLQSRKERFFLSGKVGTAGISKSCSRCYFESNFKNQKSNVDAEPYGNESSQVQVCMPAVGGYPKEVYENLDKDSTPLILSWCHLNKRKYRGEQHRAIHDSYKRAGLADKCLYFSSPLAGHEYDVYHLNEIMEFFDKFCK